MKLVQLPNDASTSKYPKTFPQPLNLLSVPAKRKTIIDIALKGFHKKQKIIYKYIDDLLLEVDKSKNLLIVNMGDYPPDAYYSKYYDYFLNKVKNAKVKIIGSYAKIYTNKLNVSSKIDVLGKFEYKNIDYRYLKFRKYPQVNKKYKANVRASIGCPRKCLMCPVPICFKNKYKYFDPAETAYTIEHLYKSSFYVSRIIKIS